MYTYNVSTWEVKAEEPLQIQDRYVLHSKL